MTRGLSKGVKVDVKVDVGSVLVAPSHLEVVMSEIWGHLKALAELRREFVFNVWIS